MTDDGERGTRVVPAVLDDEDRDHERGPNNHTQSEQHTPASPDSLNEDAESDSPSHSPRKNVWFITAGNAPLAIALSRVLLDQGHSLVLGVLPREYEEASVKSERSSAFRELLEEVRAREDWRPRVRVVGYDITSVGDCQSVVSTALSHFPTGISVLLCNSSVSLLGSIEELGQTPRTQSLVLQQFSTNFFGPANIAKAVLPSMRRARRGHIVMLTGITGHLGTPGLSAYCASQWALEGFADSLAYEVAPFDIRVSVVQSSVEVGVLTGRVEVVPAMDAYLGKYAPHGEARDGSGAAEDGEGEDMEGALGEDDEDMHDPDMAEDFDVDGDAEDHAQPTEAADANFDASHHLHTRTDTQTPSRSQRGLSASQTQSSLHRSNSAPMFRGVLGHLLDRIGGFEDSRPPSPSSSTQSSSSDAEHDDDEPDGEITEPHLQPTVSPPAPAPPVATPRVKTRTSSSHSHPGVSKSKRPSRLLFQPASSSTSKPVTVYPTLPAGMTAALVAQTVRAVAAIGGNPNPPARHIVGNEGVASVKEKLRTVSEELEEFVECSLGVDL